eukprot:CCRYP_005070-RA/>CCRYP_005070-RA protein AED:0.11 eAED:0.11 QI:159/0.66/0.5/1/1/1/4/21/584
MKNLAVRSLTSSRNNFKNYVSYLTRASIYQQQRRSYFDQSSRNSAIQSFFKILQANYGNLSDLIDKGPASETIVSPDGVLHPHHLIRLFRHEATALHVRNFYHPPSAKKLGEELVQESALRAKSGSSSNWKVSTSRGLESSDVGTLGEHTPYNVAVAQDYHYSLQDVTENTGHTTSSEKNTSSIDRYFEGVQREFRSRRIRRRFSGGSKGDQSDHYQLWPLDKLRLELEECWPSGAGLARETNARKNGSNHCHPRPFGGGLPRIMMGPTRWKRGFIHVDEMGPLDSSRGLFSANIYLTMPETESQMSGEDASAKYRIKDAGCLYIWPLGVRSRWDWYRNATTLSGLSAQDPEIQYLLHEKLVTTSVTTPVTIQCLIDNIISNGSVDIEILGKSNEMSAEEASESIGDTKEKARKGSAKHMCTLSRWYLFGEKEEVDSDDDEAYKWCKQAADAGDVDGMAYQGYCFIHGHGVDKNREEGYELLVDAACDGSAFAAYTLGCFYHTGLHGFKSDAQRAVKYLNMATKFNSEGNCNGLNKTEIENVKRYLDSYGSPLNNCDASDTSVPSKVLERKENDTVSTLTPQTQ